MWILQVKGTEYFSVPAFFVCWREAVEACVIIAVLLKFLDKVDKKQLQRDVWLGAFAGLAVAIVAGVGLIIAFYAVNKNFFIGRQEMLFEGVLSLFASVIITVLAMSMLKISKFQAMWEAKRLLPWSKLKLKALHCAAAPCSGSPSYQCCVKDLRLSSSLLVLALATQLRASLSLASLAC